VITTSLEKVVLDHIEFTDVDFTLDFLTQMPQIFVRWVDNTPISGGMPTEMGQLNHSLLA
jgi:hypothetical protein